MLFPTPLTEGYLIRRYKRFLADIQLNDGTVITAHCPNTGSMISCSSPGSAVCLSTSANQTRKYPYTLEMVYNGTCWIGVNTARTNKLVAEAIELGQISEFEKIEKIEFEKKTYSHTRLDLLLMKGERRIYVEVKNCSLAENGIAMFPDAVTARGAKHLGELSRLVKEGVEAAIFFLVQRTDADRFAAANHIDPYYAAALASAAAAGVQVIVYQAKVSPEGIHVTRPLPYCQ